MPHDECAWNDCLEGEDATMTPADLPDALALAIRACTNADERAVKTEGVEALLAKREWRRQEQRVTGLEHAVSVVTATGPELAAAQLVIAAGYLDVLTTSQRDEEFDLEHQELMLRCLLAAKRYLIGDGETPALAVIAAHYLPKHVRENDRTTLRYAAGPNPDASPAGLTGGSMSIQGESVGKMDSPVKPANDDRGDGV